jgi:glutamine amidotransferase PdxT
MLASECHLESINVNVQRNQFGQQSDGLNVNGNVRFSHRAEIGLTLNCFSAP